MQNNNKTEASKSLVHFDNFEETVIRANTPKKAAIKKRIKRKFALRKLKQIISIVSAFAVLGNVK